MMLSGCYPYMGNGYVQETFGMPSEVTQTGGLDGMAGRNLTHSVHGRLIPLHQLSSQRQTLLHMPLLRSHLGWLLFCCRCLHHICMTGWLRINEHGMGFNVQVTMSACLSGCRERSQMWDRMYRCELEILSQKSHIRQDDPGLGV